MIIRVNEYLVTGTRVHTEHIYHLGHEQKNKQALSIYYEAEQLNYTLDTREIHYYLKFMSEFIVY